MKQKYLLTKKSLYNILDLVVSKVSFKCIDSWFVQTDDEAMGAYLAVVLANIWLKKYEFAFKKELPEG